MADRASKSRPPPPPPPPPPLWLNLESYNIAKRKGLKQLNFLVWTGIRQAILPNLKRLKFNENSLEFQCWEKRFSPPSTRCEHFNSWINCLFWEKLESQEVLFSGKRNFAWTTQLFFKAFLKAGSIWTETFVMSFQFKILNDITLTTVCNYRLV